MKELIQKIKSKKPLDRLDDELVENFLNEFLKRNLKLKTKILQNSLKKKDLEIIIKSVRNELNKIYGQFWLSDKLSLEAHKSTKERMELYNRIYSSIFIFTGKPRTILDLACGLNPLTYKLINNLVEKEVYFIATELTDYDCNNLKSYFNKNNIKGEVIKVDLRSYNKFPEVDICFMFKILESLENKGHLLAEHLIKSIKARYIVVSFSTFNTRGKRMNYPRRGWLEIMINRLNYKFTKFEEYNEVFYIINK